MLGADWRSALSLSRNGDRMTHAGRRLVVLCAVAAMVAGVSSCKVLQRATSTTQPLTTAVANADVLAPSGADACPFAASDVAGALGGQWTVSSLPSGGCTYANGGRSIQVSTVPLPKGAASRTEALARLRRSCAAGSLKMIGAVAFVCRQDTLVEAVATSGDHLLVLCTAAGQEATQLPVVRAQLTALLAREVRG
jgi:hypothetical protein